MMRRLLLVGFMVLIVAFVFAGGNQAPQQSTSSEVVTITMMTEWIGEHIFADYFASEIERFHAEHGDRIRVEIEEAPDREELMPVRIAARNLPDVFVLNRTDTARIATEAGLLTNMTPYIEADPEWKASLSSGHLDYWANATGTPGQYYGVTSHGDLIPIFYNKDMFREAGITPATTWDQFWRNAEALKNAGYAPTSQGVFISDLWLLGLIGTKNAAGNEWANAVAPKNWELPVVVEGLTNLQRMIRNYSTPDAAGLPYGSALNYFTNEQTAMIAVGTWAIAAFSNPDNAAEGFDTRVGVSTFPGNGIGQNPGYAFFNAAKTKETQDAVAEFIKFFNDIDGQIQKLQMLNLPPTSTDIDLDSLDLSPILVDVLNAVPGSTSTGWPHRTIPSRVREIFNPQLSGLGTGSVTPAAMARAVTEAASR